MTQTRISPPVKTFQQSLAELIKNVPDLSRQNRFGFQILFKRLHTNVPIQEPPESVYLLCQGIGLPPIGLVTKQLRWDEGPYFNRPQGIDVGGDALAFEFMLDVDMRTKEFFESWINTIFDTEFALLSFPDVYMHDILLYTLDKFDQPRHVVKLIDAFPRSMSMISYNQASGEPASFTVTFTYHQLESWSMSDMIIEDPDDRFWRTGYRKLDKGEFPAPAGFDPTKITGGSRAAGYVEKAINFFASLNPTVYNIATKLSHKIRV